MHQPFTQRRSGVLLHPTSLPSLNIDGYQWFINFLASTRQTYWQMLPVNPVTAKDGLSPYSSISAFAGVDWLVYARIPHSDTRRARQSFLAAQEHWLIDFAHFCALRDQFGTANWTTWPQALAERDHNALKQSRARLQHEMQRYVDEQFVFHSKWRSIRELANNRGVQLIGDLPIFMAHQSADVWANQKLFLLERGGGGAPKVVAGCPPDRFNKDGQLWGNALYDWKALRRNQYAWWTQRVARLLELFDAVRLDHFIGFERYWAIPAHAKNAKPGKWCHADGRGLLTTLSKTHKHIPIIAEDLGAVTKEVTQLRLDFALPGMHILQFGFNPCEDIGQHQLHRFARNGVAYTGTHDNETTLGWYQRLRREKSDEWRALCDATGFTGRDGAPIDVAWRMNMLVMHSQANTTVIPVQDILGLDNRHRMNIPGTARGNWLWRLSPAHVRELNGSAGKRLLRMTLGSARA